MRDVQAKGETLLWMDLHIYSIPITIDNAKISWLRIVGILQGIFELNKFKSIWKKCKTLNPINLTVII